MHSKSCMKLTVDAAHCKILARFWLGLLPQPLEKPGTEAERSEAVEEFRDRVCDSDCDDNDKVMSSQDAKASMYYAAKYLSKNPVKLTECLSLHTVVEQKSRGSVHVWTSSRL